MNILDKLAAVLTPQSVEKGNMPDMPDDMIGLFEYRGGPPEHYFDGTDIIYSVQVRVRNPKSVTAYITAAKIAAKLNRYQDGEISILQSTSILDIGKEPSRNPPRHEYTVNFTIRRL